MLMYFLTKIFMKSSTPSHTDNCQVSCLLIVCQQFYIVLKLKLKILSPI